MGRLAHIHSRTRARTRTRSQHLAHCVFSRPGGDFAAPVASSTVVDTSSALAVRDEAACLLRRSTDRELYHVHLHLHPEDISLSLFFCFLNSIWDWIIRFLRRAWGVHIHAHWQRNLQHHRTTRVRSAVMTIFMITSLTCNDHQVYIRFMSECGLCIPNIGTL